MITHDFGVESIEQWKTVADMLGIRTKEFAGGVESCGFSLDVLSRVLELGFIKPEYKFNDSPTVKTFLEFGQRAETFGATVEYIGFLESKYRKDACLVVTGVKVTSFPDSVGLVLDFSQTFHDADEFTTNASLLRAWYD